MNNTDTAPAARIVNRYAWEFRTGDALTTRHGTHPRTVTSVAHYSDGRVRLYFGWSSTEYDRDAYLPSLPR